MGQATTWKLKMERAKNSKVKLVVGIVSEHWCSDVYLTHDILSQKSERLRERRLITECKDL